MGNNEITLTKVIFMLGTFNTGVKRELKVFYSHGTLIEVAYLESFFGTLFWLIIKSIFTMTLTLGYHLI